MTTINKSEGEVTNLFGPISPGGPNTNFDIGWRRYRNSTGGDQSFRNPERWTTISYMTKPFIQKGVVVRPVEQKFKKVWKKLPRRAYDEEHAYTALHERVEVSAGLGLYRLGAWYNMGTPFNWDLTTVPDPWSDNDQLALLGKLREAVAGSNFNAGVAIAEFPKAIAMIASSATKIHAAYRAVRRGNPAKAAQVLTGRAPPKRVARNLKPHKEAASSNWLELQYGWLPLVNDAYGASVFIDHHLRHPVIHRVTVMKNAGGIQYRLGELNLPAPYAKHLVQISSSSRLVAKLKNVDVPQLAGLMDPASIAWELVPFSFVADWFIPVGSYLDAQALERALTGTFVTTHKFTVRSLRKKAKTSWQLSSTNDGSKCFFERVNLTRTVSSSLSIPRPSVKPLGKVATWAHAANAVALLISSKAAH